MKAKTYVRLCEVNLYTHKKTFLLLIMAIPIFDACFICAVLLIAKEAYFYRGQKASGQKTIALLSLLTLYLIG